MPGYEELHHWYDRDRKDNFTTTMPAWHGAPGAHRAPNYRWSGVYGRVLSESDPGGRSRPLNAWWSPGRMDNATLTDPAWAPDGEPRPPDYGYHRLDGHTLIDPVAGCWPLYRWWSPSRLDNATTAHPAWWPVGEQPEENPDYRWPHHEGWVIPNEGELSNFPPHAVQFAAKPVRGTRPLVVILLEFADAPLDRFETDEEYRQLVFGPGEPNIARYFSALSGGRFTFTDAGVVRISFPRTESVEGADNFVVRLMRRVAAAGIDFSQFDTDSDGVVGPEDLVVMRMVSSYDTSPPSGQTTSFSMPLSGVTLRAVPSSNCNEHGAMSLYGHELFHALGFSAHSYGPGARVNSDATLFAAHRTDTDPRGGPVYLDPMNRILTGWVRPRVVQVSSAAGSTVLSAAQMPATYTPLVFLDHERGYDDLIILEYRTPDSPFGPGYDAAVLGQGVAAWNVLGWNRNGEPRGISWPPAPGVRPVPEVTARMVGNFLQGPAEPGEGPFWTPADGEFGLNWADGTDSGLRFRVGPMSPGAPLVACRG